MGNTASAAGDPNLNRALRESLQTEASVAERRRRAAGGHNAEERVLQEVLQLSAASAEKKRRAASATRKRAASVERRRAAAARAAEEERVLQEVLQLSAVEATAAERRRAASAERRRAAAAEAAAEDPNIERALQISTALAAEVRAGAQRADPRGRHRRKSGNFKGALAAAHARELVGCSAGGVHAYDNYRLIVRIIEYSEKMRESFFTEQHTAQLHEGYNFTPRIGDYECVGVILGFRLSTGGGHFVPYIRINGDWYNGDDEKGVLVSRTNGIPTMQTKYVDTYGVVDDRSTIFVPIAFYCRTDKIKARRQKDYTGTPVFGQSGLTCGPDASQTIFMLADGFHSVFDEQIYRVLERDFDPKLSAWHPELITEEVLNSEIAKLNRILNRILKPYEVDDDINKFILMMCIRYFSVENTPEESLAIIEITPNTTH